MRSKNLEQSLTDWHKYSAFGTDIFRINKLKEIQELKPLVEKELKSRKR
ncbi:hypothetical protein [Lactobacillus iners]|nr:hypothetical protein [Lactobacillus iners]MDK7306180.1 hypothetical protein [Lactobacillus iners]